jgi:hypothetical protein
MWNCKYREVDEYYKIDLEFNEENDNEYDDNENKKEDYD